MQNHEQRVYVYVWLVGYRGHLGALGRCLFMCSARWSDRAKDRSQTAHLKGFAPVRFR